MEHVLVLGGAGGGTHGCDEGLPESFPLRAAASAPPTCLFQDLRAEQIGSFELGAHARGRLRTIDTPVRLANYGKLEDVDVEIEAWADRKTDFDAVIIEGPANPVSPVPGAPSGTNYALPCNLKIRISCHRIAEAAANGNAAMSALRLHGGLLDEETVSFSLNGTARVRSTARCRRRALTRRPTGPSGGRELSWKKGSHRSTLRPSRTSPRRPPPSSSRCAPDP
jgi:hypothetical protein